MGRGHLFEWKSGRSLKNVPIFRIEREHKENLSLTRNKIADRCVKLGQKTVVEYFLIPFDFFFLLNIFKIFFHFAGKEIVHILFRLKMFLRTYFLVGIVIY